MLSKGKLCRTAYRSRQTVARQCLISTSRLAQTSRPFTSMLEVERNFLPTNMFRSCLDTAVVHGKASPCQIMIDGVTLQHHSCQLINDRYFDVDHHLARQGLWARRRIYSMQQEPSEHHSATVWEIKQRAGGDYVNAVMVEHEGREKVLGLWRGHFSRDLMADEDISADLLTARQSWSARDAYTHGDIHIVLDHVTLGPTTIDSNDISSFEHFIGEVELTSVVTEGVTIVEHDIEKQQRMNELNNLVAAFMHRHPTMFVTDPAPVGKLSAYFAWTASRKKM